MISNSIPCSNCDSTRSEYWCENCYNNYCAECCRTLHDKPAFRNHQLVSLREKRTELKSCTEHTDEKLKYWCQQCNTLVCSDCRLNKHQNHPATFVYTVVDELQEKVTLPFFLKMIISSYEFIC